MNIRIDHRERRSGIPDLLRGTDFSIDMVHLPYGDYVINQVFTIERKTARDLLISIIDGRLFRQLSNLKKHCLQPLLLIEGNPYGTDLDFDSGAIRGALVSIQVMYYTPLLFSTSPEETREIFLLIGRQEQGRSEGLPRCGYRPKRLLSRQRYVLQGLPHVGPTLADRLLVHFGSVAGVMNGTVKELTRVEGIGPVSARAIRELLDQEFQPGEAPFQHPVSVRNR